MLPRPSQAPPVDDDEEPPTLPQDAPLPLPSQPSDAKRIRPIHWVAIASVLFVGIVLVLVLLLGIDAETSHVASTPSAKVEKADISAHKSEEPASDSPKETANQADASPKPTGNEETMGAGQVGSADTSAESHAEETAKAPSGPAGLALIAPPKFTCRPLSEYPDFPWKKEFTSLLKKLELTGICQLFGTLNAAAVSAGFNHLSHAGPYGNDSLTGGTRVEAYPTGQTNHQGPRIEFLLHDNLLYEIRFHYYGEYTKQVPAKMFASLLGSSGAAQKDPFGRWFSQYQDGDMIVEQMEKTDKYRRKFRWVVFGSKEKRNALDIIKGANRNVDAEVTYSQGMAFYGDRKFNLAMKRFRTARRLNDRYGMAYFREALLLLRDERFDMAVEAVEKILEKSRDERAQAEAQGVLAVVALSKNDKESALEHYRKADALDPANKNFAQSLRELDTGKYAPERVAKTAARMECQKTRQGAKWTVPGLLARGNFPDYKTYRKVLKRAKRSRAFKTASQRWIQWECR